MRRTKSLALGAATLCLGACSTAPQAPYRPLQSVHLARPALEELPGKRRALEGPPVRVLLRRGSSGLKASAPGGLRLLDAQGRELGRLQPSGQGRLAAKNGLLHFSGRSLGVKDARVEPLVADEEIKVAGKRYAGHLLLKILDGELALINVVGLEDYVKGVLPGEVPANWPQAALQAQAIAARTFAASNMVKGKNAGFDLDDSTSSQVYKGRSAQKPSSDAAVQSTRGLVLTYADSLANTFFHSNSGGHTANATDVWGGKAPAYLQGVQDPYSEDQQHYAWTARITLERAERQLTAAGLWQGLLLTVQGEERGDSGHWRSLRLQGPGQNKVIRAQAFRQAMGGDLLKSTRFRVQTAQDSLDFDGLGWGHGVGLAQEGALSMAKDGRGYRGILAHYYPGTRLSTLR